MLRRALIVVVLAVLAGAAAPAPAESGPARLEAFLGSLKSLSADFEQRVFDEHGKPLETSSGKFWVERPGRFRWDYAKPYAQLIVGDGTRVWIYDEPLQQVTVKRMGKAIGSTPAMLLSTDRPVTEDFEVSDLGTEGGLARVRLRPRAADASFSEIRLAFDGDRLASMELVDNFGQHTRIEFSSMKRNPVLDPSLFRFEPPPGVDVLDATRR